MGSGVRKRKALASVSLSKWGCVFGGCKAPAEDSALCSVLGEDRCPGPHEAYIGIGEDITLYYNCLFLISGHLSSRCTAHLQHRRYTICIFISGD